MTRERADFDDRRRIARIAGLAYLATIVAGMFAEVVVRGSIRVAGNAGATAANIMASELLYSLGIFADLVMLGCYAAVTALLYRLFKQWGPALSLAAACFSLIGIAMLAAALALLSAPLMLLGQAAYQQALPLPHREALAYLTLQLHGRAYGLTGFFFGLYCMSIGWLVIRSRELPRAIGWLMALAGAVFLIDTSLDLLAPGLGAAVPDVVMLISLVGEGSLALWLAFRGIAPRDGSATGDSASPTGAVEQA